MNKINLPNIFELLNMEKDIQTIKYRLNADEQRLSVDEGKINVNIKSISDLVIKVDDNIHSIGTINNKISNYYSRLVNDEKSISSNIKSISNLSDKIAKNIGDISNLYSDVSDLGNKIAKNVKDIANLDSKLGDMNSRISSNEKSIASINSNLSIEQTNLKNALGIDVFSKLSSNPLNLPKSISISLNGAMTTITGEIAPINPILINIKISDYTDAKRWLNDAIHGIYKNMIVSYQTLLSKIPSKNLLNDIKNKAYSSYNSIVKERDTNIPDFYISINTIMGNQYILLSQKNKSWSSVMPHGKITLENIENSFNDLFTTVKDKFNKTIKTINFIINGIYQKLSSFTYEISQFGSSISNINAILSKDRNPKISYHDGIDYGQCSSNSSNLCLGYTIRSGYWKEIFGHGITLKSIDTIFKSDIPKMFNWLTDSMVSSINNILSYIYTKINSISYLTNQFKISSSGINTIADVFYNARGYMNITCNNTNYKMSSLFNNLSSYFSDIQSDLSKLTGYYGQIHDLASSFSSIYSSLLNIANYKNSSYTGYLSNFASYLSKFGNSIYNIQDIIGNIYSDNYFNLSNTNLIKKFNKLWGISINSWFNTKFNGGGDDLYVYIWDPLINNGSGGWIVEGSSNPISIMTTLINKIKKHIQYAVDHNSDVWNSSLAADDIYTSLYEMMTIFEIFESMFGFKIKSIYRKVPNHNTYYDFHLSKSNGSAVCSGDGVDCGYLINPIQMLFGIFQSYLGSSYDGISNAVSQIYDILYELVYNIEGYIDGISSTLYTGTSTISIDTKLEDIKKKAGKLSNNLSCLSSQISNIENLLKKLKNITSNLQSQLP